MESFLCNVGQVMVECIQDASEFLLPLDALNELVSDTHEGAFELSTALQGQLTIMDGTVDDESHEKVCTCKFDPVDSELRRGAFFVGGMIRTVLGISTSIDTGGTWSPLLVLHSAVLEDVQSQTDMVEIFSIECIIGLSIIALVIKLRQKAAAYEQRLAEAPRNMAEAALQAALSEHCINPISKKTSQRLIFEEQRWAHLQTLFAKAQDHMPMKGHVVRHAELQTVRAWAARLRERGGEISRITWSTDIATDDYMAYVTLHQQKKAVGLNYADGSRPGGGFENGKGGQETSLCCCSNYYQSLVEAQEILARTNQGPNRHGFADVRSAHGRIQVRATNRLRKGAGEEEWHFWDPTEEFQEYATVIVSTNVRRYRAIDGGDFKLLQPSDQYFATFVAAAAPRWAEHTGHRVPAGSLTSAGDAESDMLFNGTDSSGQPEPHGKRPLREAIESIVLAPKLINPDLQVLVIGPWGGAELRGNFKNIIQYLGEVLTDTNALYLYEEVHFSFYFCREPASLEPQLRTCLPINADIRRVTSPAIFREFQRAPDDHDSSTS